jgi:hypothetical protein
MHEHGGGSGFGFMIALLIIVSIFAILGGIPKDGPPPLPPREG